MKVISLFILLSLTLFSCADKDEDIKSFDYGTEVIAVFTPRKFGDQTDAGLYYKGLVKATDSLGVAFHPIFPTSFEDGAKIITRLASRNEPGRKRLIISTDPEYSSYIHEAASKGGIVDSDSTKLLVLDGGVAHHNIYTAHIPLYGTMYKAGYIASRMSDVDSVRIYIANDKYLYMREGRDGFIDGFTKCRENTIDVVDLSTWTLSDTEGFLCDIPAYIYHAPQCYEHFDMVVPICGATIMGFIRYNRDFPGRFYTVGVETDMSILSDDVPFSCVKHTDRVISTCIADWRNGRLERNRTFGMEGDWVELIVSEGYKQILEPLSQEIHDQAKEMEANYAR